MGEKEIAFYAQYDDGTVWYLGEHPEEYEDGEFVKAPTWIHGLEEARAGVKMLADPALHTQSLFQKLRVSMNEVVRSLITLMDQRVVHIEQLHAVGPFA